MRNSRTAGNGKQTDALQGAKISTGLFTLCLNTGDCRSKPHSLTAGKRMKPCFRAQLALLCLYSVKLCGVRMLQLDA